MAGSFSAIDGDPSLGDGVKCYATLHLNYRIPEQEVLRRLVNTAMYLKFLAINVIREKIELVIHDTKSSTVRIDEGGTYEQIGLLPGDENRQVCDADSVRDQTGRQRLPISDNAERSPHEVTCGVSQDASSKGDYGNKGGDRT